MLSRRLLVGALPLFVAGIADAQPLPVQIYAAMTFRAALEAVLVAYRATGGSAVAVYGPTPVLVRQLASGAPADILLTSDPTWMDDAAAKKLIRPDTRANLLANDLVLAGPAGAAAAGEISKSFALDTLLAGGRLAMCDPERDPAGRYAKQSLEALGLWPAVVQRIAIAETSLAAVALLDRGEVQGAIGFATDLHGDGRAVIVGRFPPDTHAPIVYPVALTAGMPNPHAADTLGFLRSKQALHIFVEHGYLPPP